MMTVQGECGCRMHIARNWDIRYIVSLYGSGWSRAWRNSPRAYLLLLYFVLSTLACS